MGIKQDRSGLPTRTAVGHPPVAHPVFAPVLVHRWYREYVEGGNVDLAKVDPSLPFRGSYAGARCDRQLFYKMTDVPASDPPTLADHWRFNIGTMVHVALQACMPDAFERSQSEVEVDLRVIGIPGSQRVDIVTYAEDGSVDAVIEVKSINGFGFKKSATSFKGPAEGPRSGAVVQGAMAASALKAKRMVIMYLSLENVSPQMATSFAPDEIGRFAAEWHYTPEEFEPIAQTEAARISRVLRFLPTPSSSSVGLPPRELHDPELPVGAVIDDPKAARWAVTEQTLDGPAITDAGKTWFCDYCDHRTQCVADGPGGFIQDGLF